MLAAILLKRSDITSAVKYLTVVIPAKAGIQEGGSKLKSLDAGSSPAWRDVRGVPGKRYSYRDYFRRVNKLPDYYARLLWVCAKEIEPKIVETEDVLNGLLRALRDD